MGQEASPESWAEMTLPPRFTSAETSHVLISLGHGCNREKPELTMLHFLQSQNKELKHL